MGLSDSFKSEGSSFLRKLLFHLNDHAPAFQTSGAPLSKWLWLWVPVIFYVVVLASNWFDPVIQKWVIRHELGLGENLTTLWFLGAAFVGILLYRQRAAFAGHWLRPLFLVFAGVAVFVAGEEASWGQHFFGWGTPEWVVDLNKQNETNLHNMAERVLDQKPRAIISIVILLFGVIMPWLYRKGKFASLRSYPIVAWLMPTPQMIPVALLTFLPRLPDRIQANLDISLGPLFNLPTRYYQEIQEFYIGLFFFLYALTLYLRLKNRPL